MSHKRGFTLIELLVVIAVIGILASSVIIGLSRAQTRARDAARKSDLDQVRKALAAYIIDNPSGYPTAGATQGAITKVASLVSDAKFVAVLDGVVAPVDPRDADGADWEYKYINNFVKTDLSGWNDATTGTAKDSYTVWAHMESPKKTAAANKAIWWHVNSKGASAEVQMATTGIAY